MNKIANVVQEGRFVKVYLNGTDISKDVPQAIRLAARNSGKDVEFINNQWTVSGVDTSTAPVVKQELPQLEEAVVMDLKADETVESIDIKNVVNFVHRDAPALRPDHFFISELKWKYLVRAVMRGKNIMMTGPAGTGKTMAVKHIVNALQRPHYYFNLGATQDPRTTLIGNTHFKKDEGTYFAQSLFVTAIQTENAVILLDEKDDAPTIKVAKNVSFIATANIGNDYTSTRTMDRALMDRFVVVEMDTLKLEDEYALLCKLYPKANSAELRAIAEIGNETRINIKSDNPKVSALISTRMSVEMGSLLVDGFTLAEIAEVAIYPFFSEEGGLDSERTYMKQLVQKYIKTTDKALFNTEDATAASAF